MKFWSNNEHLGVILISILEVQDFSCFQVSWKIKASKFLLSHSLYKTLNIKCKMRCAIKLNFNLILQSNKYSRQSNELGKNYFSLWNIVEYNAEVSLLSTVTSWVNALSYFTPLMCLQEPAGLRWVVRENEAHLVWLTNEHQLLSDHQSFSLHFPLWFPFI